MRQHSFILELNLNILYSNMWRYSDNYLEDFADNVSSNHIQSSALLLNFVTFTLRTGLETYETFGEWFIDIWLIYWQAHCQMYGWLTRLSTTSTKQRPPSAPWTGFHWDKSSHDPDPPRFILRGFIRKDMHNIHTCSSILRFRARDAWNVVNLCFS